MKLIKPDESYKEQIVTYRRESNIGSKKTILKNGGIYEKTVFCEGDNVNLERYWIEL